MVDAPPVAVHTIGIPNPRFEGDINLYLIAGDPLTLVDTGIGTPEGLQFLEAGLAAHGVRVEDIGQVVLTHKHADHMGLAAEIRERAGATIYIHEDDLDGVVDLDQRHAEFIPLVCERLRAFHTPEEEVQELARFLNHGVRLARQTTAEKLVDGQRLFVSRQELEIIHTPGHTQGSICVRFGRHMFTGDHILPKITPNIGAGEMRRTGMMSRYLQALDRIASYQTDDLIAYPGHGPTFTNLAERAAYLKSHHEEREAKIVEILRSGGPKTVYEIARSFWSRLPNYHLALGTSEVNAHLEKSAAGNRVRSENGRFFAA